MNLLKNKEAIEQKHFDFAFFSTMCCWCNEAVDEHNVDSIRGCIAAYLNVAPWSYMNEGHNTLTKVKCKDCGIELKQMYKFSGEYNYWIDEEGFTYCSEAANSRHRS